MNEREGSKFESARKPIFPERPIKILFPVELADGRTTWVMMPKIF